MAEYFFVPTGTVVTSDSPLTGPLYRPVAAAAAPAAKTKAPARKAKAAPRRRAPKGE